MDLQSPPASFRSKVWAHFGFKVTDHGGKKVRVPDITICRHCSSDVSYKTGNTTNMISHMKRHHSEIFGEESAQACSRKEKVQPKGQLSLFDCMKTKAPSKSHSRAITQSIGKFIACDIRPVSFVENVGFMTMIKTLEPK